MPIPARVPYTYRDYRALPDDGKRYEILGGDLFVSLASRPWHQTVSRRLQYALMTLLEEPGLAWVYNAPVDVVLGQSDVVHPTSWWSRAIRPTSSPIGRSKACRGSSSRS